MFSVAVAFQAEQTEAHALEHNAGAVVGKDCEDSTEQNGLKYVFYTASTSCTGPSVIVDSALAVLDSCNTFHPTGSFTNFGLDENPSCNLCPTRRTEPR